MALESNGPNARTPARLRRIAERGQLGELFTRERMTPPEGITDVRSAAAVEGEREQKSNASSEHCDHTKEPIDTGEHEARTE